MGVTFDALFAVAPSDLLQLGQIFANPALPLFRSPAFRAISLALAVESLGPLHRVKKHSWRRASQTASSASSPPPGRAGGADLADGVIRVQSQEEREQDAISKLQRAIRAHRARACLSGLRELLHVKRYGAAVEAAAVSRVASLDGSAATVKPTMEASSRPLLAVDAKLRE